MADLACLEVWEGMEVGKKKKKKQEPKWKTNSLIGRYHGRAAKDTQQGMLLPRTSQSNTRRHPRRAIWYGCTLRFNDGMRVNHMQHQFFLHYTPNHCSYCRTFVL